MRNYRRHSDYHEAGCLELFVLCVVIFLLVATALSFALQAGYLR
jgi:hypothetical protein